MRHTILVLSMIFLIATGVALAQSPLAKPTSPKRSQAATETGSSILYPLFKYGEYGYINVSGQWLIPPQFEYAEPFSEGLALVRVGGKWGYIDKSGSLVINPQFQESAPEKRMNFSGGLAAVRLQIGSKTDVRNSGTAIGFIDKTGRVVIRAQFDEASQFHNGIALVRVNCKAQWIARECGQGFINKTGRMVIKLNTPEWVRCNDINHGTVSGFNEGLASVRTKECKVGFIDKTGRFVINPQFDEVGGFNEGYAAVKVGDKWGFINKLGKFVINPQFGEARGFSYGLASVGSVTVAGGSVYWNMGYIDKTGRFVIPPQFQWAPSFSSDGTAVVKKNDRWCRIDQRGQVLLCAEWLGSSQGIGELLSLSGKVISLRHSHGGSTHTSIGGYLDKDGRYIVNPKLEEIGGFSDGLGQIRINGKWGYMNSTGKVVIQPQFDDAFSFSEGLARIVIGNKVGFINRNGTIVISPQYEHAGSFSSGLAPVLQNKRYGFINTKGQVVIPFSYDEADDFNDGMARVKVDDRFGYVNSRGEMVIPTVYDAAFPFSEGLAGVKQDGKFGFIDKNGRIFIPLRFDNDSNPDDSVLGFSKPNSFSDGLAAVKDRGLWGYIDTRGKFVIRPQYRGAINFTGGIAWVDSEDGPGIRPIGRDGAFLSKYELRAAVGFTSEGLTWVGDFSGWELMTINQDFDKVIEQNRENPQLRDPVRYDSVTPFSEGLALVEVGGKWGYIDRQGRYVWPPSK